MQELIDLLSKYPLVMQIVVAMGTARLVFKPLMVFLEEVVQATPSQKDNELLGKAKSSYFYKALAFVLDYVGSIKIPK